jgi:hypothetical protein
MDAPDGITMHRSVTGRHRVLDRHLNFALFSQHFTRRNIMKRAYIKAYNKLAKLGCPVYEHYDDNGNFSISAEDALSDTWLNYYDGDSYLENPEFGKSGRLCQILRDHGLFAEWVNPGRASVYEI